MQRTKVSVLLLTASITVVIGWVGIEFLEDHGEYFPPVPWIVDVALVALAVLVLWAGWTVRAYQQGKRPNLDGVRAARTLVLAKAASMTGALLAGWYGAQVLVAIRDYAIDTRREKAIAAAIAVGCAIVLAVAGMIAERFCQLPPASSGDGLQDGREDPGTPNASTPA